MLPNITTVNFQGLSVHALPMKKTWYSLHVSNRSYAFELANVNYLMVYIFFEDWYTFALPQTAIVIVNSNDVAQN